MQHSLDIVRKNIEKISEASAAGLIPEGIAAIISAPSFDAVDVRQCSTKIRKEIEQQRDLFWGIRVSISIGKRISPGGSLALCGQSLRKSLRPRRGIGGHLF